MNRLYTLLACLAMSTALLAQSAKARQLSDYIRNIGLFNQENPQEKVYLHFDNTGYFLGDTIWFKAYTVTAPQLKPTALSKVLHVELLTPKGEVIDDKQLPITDGQSHGEFALPPAYRSGFYEVRAYTRAMLNFGEACLFSRVFPIYEVPEVPGDYIRREMKGNAVTEKNSRHEPEKLDRVNLTFYPEGGQAVAGLRSRVAFEVRNQRGEAIEAVGALYNSRGETVAALATVHQGMGVFDFIPQAGESYQATVGCLSKSYTFPLDGIKPEGHTLYINNLDTDRLTVTLAKSASLPRDTVALSVSCRGVVYDVQACALGNEPFTCMVDKNKLPAGVLQVTAYNAQGHILAERLAFNNRMTQRLYTTVKTDKDRYRPFDKVRMEIAVRDSAQQGIPATLSLAVRDAATQLYTAYEENILTDLLLSSDLKGYIEKPMQYFTADDRPTRTKLDLLMMVQGWRRYSWPLMAGTLPFEPVHFVEPGLPVYGQVISLTSRKPLKDMKVTFWMSQDSAALHGTSTTRDNGRFFFAFPDSLYLTGSWQLGLMTSQKGKRKHSRLMLDRLYSPQGRGYSHFDEWVKDTVPAFPKDTVTTSVAQMQYLPEVTIRRKVVHPGISAPDVVIDLERIVTRWQDEGAVYPGTVGEYLEKYVPLFNYARYEMKRIETPDRMVRHELVEADNTDGLPVELFYRYGRYETVWGISYKNEATWSKYNREPYTYNRISLDDVQRIEVYSSNKYKYQEFPKETAMHLPEPDFSERPTVKEYVLVLLYLYDDGLHDGYKKGMRQTRYKAYSPVHEFYHVDNSNRVPGESDYRRTLYWNPYVKTDSNGRAVVEFYNNSTCRQMEVEAAGITRQAGIIHY